MPKKKSKVTTGGPVMWSVIQNNPASSRETLLTASTPSQSPRSRFRTAGDTPAISVRPLSLLALWRYPRGRAFALPPFVSHLAGSSLAPQRTIIHVAHAECQFAATTQQPPHRIRRNSTRVYWWFVNTPRQRRPDFHVQAVYRPAWSRLLHTGITLQHGTTPGTSAPPSCGP